MLLFMNAAWSYFHWEEGASLIYFKDLFNWPTCTDSDLPLSKRHWTERQNNFILFSCVMKEKHLVFE